jgi:thioredoxin 1
MACEDSTNWHTSCLTDSDAVENMSPDKAQIVEIGERNFESEVLRSKQPVLVAFWAPWSRPCHVIKSVLDEVVTACAGRAKVVKVNADDHPDLGLWYDIQSIPTLLCFVNGKVCVRVVGTASKEAILSKLEPILRGI